MVQAVAFICGFETGDGSEIQTLGSTSAIQSSTVRTGNYADQVAAIGSQLTGNAFLAATQSVIRGYLQVPALPGAPTSLITESTAGTNRLRLRFNASNNLQITDLGVTLGLTTTAGTATFNTGQWYRIEMALDLAASGVVKVWVDGTLDISVTHTNDVSASLTGAYTIHGAASPNQYFWDDMRIDKGGVAAIGAGQCIARQGKAGAPAFDTWTKTGLATAALCWSETPFSATNNCNSAVSAAKQTMLVEKFSITQSGHGSQVVGSSDTVNACKTAFIMNTVSGDATGAIIRIINGAETDTIVTDTASDKYLDDGIWTTTAANLDLLEAGVKHGNNTRLTTVEDGWVIVDYTPSGFIQPPLFMADLSVPAPARRSIALFQPQYQRAEYIIGAENLPKLAPTWDVPPPRRYPMENRGFLHDLDAQLIGKDTTPKFTADLSIPPPRRLPLENRGFVRDLDAHLIGKDTLPASAPDLRPPQPARRSAVLPDTQSPSFPGLWLIGVQPIPVQAYDLRIPPARLFSRSLLEWTTEPPGPPIIPPTPIVSVPSVPSGGIGMRRFDKKGRLRYPAEQSSPFEGYTREQLQRMVFADLPRLDEAEWQEAKDAVEARTISPKALDALPIGFDLMRARAIEIGAGLLLAELRAAKVRRDADDEDETIALLLLLS
jgi:hypothetical protein